MEPDVGLTKQDLQQIEVLEACGDYRSFIREVHHMAFFNSGEEAKGFGKWLRAQGHKVGRVSRDGEVSFTTLCSLESPAFDDLLTQLRQQAYDSFGCYDGWGSSIAKAA